jgi:hypothetical protein
VPNGDDDDNDDNEQTAKTVLRRCVIEIHSHDNRKYTELKAAQQTTYFTTAFNS